MARAVLKEGQLIGPGGMSEATTQEDVFQKAMKEYPILNRMDLMYKNNPGAGNGMLEFWPPDESGTPQYPRPVDFPMGKAGVEVYDQNTRPIDILGDVVSHQLVQTDPTIKQHYEEFQQSMTPDQQSRLREQYQYAQQNEGEKRPFDQWSKLSGVPAYFRGYPFQQWDNPQELYTPEQMKKFDAMMEYLRK